MSSELFCCFKLWFKASDIKKSTLRLGFIRHLTFISFHNSVCRSPRKQLFKNLKCHTGGKSAKKVSRMIWMAPNDVVVEKKRMISSFLFLNEEGKKYKAKNICSLA